MQRTWRLNWNEWQKNWGQERILSHVAIFGVAFWFVSVVRGGGWLRPCWSLIMPKPKRQLSPDFFSYRTPCGPKCLTLPAKCCKNLSFDLTDGKDLFTHEAHPLTLLWREATHQISLAPLLAFRALFIFWPILLILFYPITSSADDNTTEQNLSFCLSPDGLGTKSFLIQYVFFGFFAVSQAVSQGRRKWPSLSLGHK